MRRRTFLMSIVVYAAVLLLSAAAQGASPDLVVSQVFAGGGNAGATFTNDYVELFNRGNSTVDLSGWTVQYATAAGTSWAPTALTGTVHAGRAPSRPTRRRRERLGTARTRLDGHDEPLDGRRQGRARPRHRSVDVRGLGRKLLGRRRDSRPPRLRDGHRLRGRRRACAHQLDCRGSCGRRLHRHGRERVGLHSSGSGPAQLVRAGGTVHRGRPDGVAVGERCRRRLLEHLADARTNLGELRDGGERSDSRTGRRACHRREQRPSRVRAERAPDRLHAGRPSTRPVRLRSGRCAVSRRNSPAGRWSRSRPPPTC